MSTRRRAAKPALAAVPEDEAASMVDEEEAGEGVAQIMQLLNAVEAQRAAQGGRRVARSRPWPSHGGC